MNLENLVNVQQATRILKISKRALHQRIKVGYYGAKRIGTVLIDPEAGEPITPNELKTIAIRPRGRQPGKYGTYTKRRKGSTKRRAVK